MAGCHVSDDGRLAQLGVRTATAMAEVVDAFVARVPGLFTFFTKVTVQRLGAALFLLIVNVEIGLLLTEKEYNCINMRNITDICINVSIYNPIYLTCCDEMLNSDLQKATFCFTSHNHKLVSHII